MHVMNMHILMHCWYIEMAKERHGSVKTTIVNTQGIQEYISKITSKEELLKGCLKQKSEEDQADEMPWQSIVPSIDTSIDIYDNHR
ncbi:unnamed protein product [Dracunculus medinensis]|uniref:Ovule protein n=1 Tax=Dracunculus medinensis TaxID=318479 RepID=A0A0N4U0M0_DRAME|nr:unnamed protein product [Dracunculus medinensis]